MPEEFLPESYSWIVLYLSKSDSVESGLEPSTDGIRVT